MSDITNFFAWVTKERGVTFKHLQGEHDQSAHGREGGSGVFPGYFGSDKTHKKEIIEGSTTTRNGKKETVFSRSVGHEDGYEWDAKVITRQNSKDNYSIYSSKTSFVGSDSVLIGNASSPKEAKSKARDLLSRLVDAHYSGAVYEGKDGKFFKVDYGSGTISEVDERL